MPLPNPTFDIKNSDDLNKFLLGVLKDVRVKEIEIDRAEAISKISDKIIKNNLVQMMYRKHMRSDEPIEFWEPSEKKVIAGLLPNNKK